MTSPEFAAEIRFWPLAELVREHQFCAARKQDKTLRSKAWIIEKECLRRAYKQVGEVPAKAPRVSYP